MKTKNIFVFCKLHTSINLKNRNVIVLPLPFHLKTYYLYLTNNEQFA